MHTLTDNYTTESDQTYLASASDNTITAADEIDNLVIRLAGADDDESIDELTARAGGSKRPSGALLLAAVDGRVLAAASMSRREAVSEPTLAGVSARAVVEYTLAGRERRRRMQPRAA
jgi:hypothetical protein